MPHLRKKVKKFSTKYNFQATILHDSKDAVEHGPELNMKFTDHL